VIRGSSGAEICLLIDTVVKYDTTHTGTRVRDQGIWLRRYVGTDTTSLPYVTEVHCYGYTMERLNECEIPRSADEILKTCDRIIINLESIWSLERSKHRLRCFDGGEHKRYVRRLLRQVKMTEYRDTLRDFGGRVNWRNLTVGLTHGDPIIDNVMERPIEGSRTNRTKMVIIDPIPACDALPDVTAVDVGRVIQSAVGYEVLRYPDGELREHIGVRRGVNHVINAWQTGVFNIDDVRAALLFSIIHMMRGVRTAYRVAPECVESLVNVTRGLIKETIVWMQ
jgi:hypothetical protein